MKYVSLAHRLLVLFFLFIVISCDSIYREEIRPAQSYSKNYFFHVVRYQGETLTLISRWYTLSDSNALEIKRLNRYLADVSEPLPLKTRVFIPRGLVKIQKLMPVGFVNNTLPQETNTPISDMPLSEELDTRVVPSPIPPVVTTGTPGPIVTSPPAITSSPMPHEEPAATVTPANTLEPIPTSMPTPTRRDFLEEDPSESRDSLIKIPAEILEDLKQLAPPVASPQNPLPTQIQLPELPMPSREPTFQPVTPEYNRLKPFSATEEEATVSEDRKNLLDLLKQQGNTKQ